MQQKISYSGISCRPDDYNCNDGELTTVLNLVNDGGALRPVEKPDRIISLGQGDRLLYIHRGNGYLNYILYSGTTREICFIPEGYSAGEKIHILDAGYGDKELDSLIVTLMGNTLIIIDTTGVHYLLHKRVSPDDKPEKSVYQVLGAKPPLPSITFGLNGNFELSDIINDIIDGHVGSDTIPPAARNGSFSLKDITAGSQAYVDEVIGKFTDGIIPRVNKFIMEEATDKNRFIFPFFVRYAYRMYDGSYIMHSYPVLMVPVNGCNPVFFADRMNCRADGDNNGVPQTQLNIGGYVSALLCNLDYKFNGYSDNNIEEWKDIIKGVDIFVTAPVYTYDQNGKVYGWRRLADNEKHGNHAIARINNPSMKWILERPSDTLYKSYGDHTYEYQFACAHNSMLKPLTNTSDAIETFTGFKTPRYFMELPQIKEGEWIKNIQESSLFYRIASLEFSELKNDGDTHNIIIRENLLKTLQQQPRLEEDYKSHCRTGAECAYVYNSRLNIGNITEYIFNGMPVDSQFTRWDLFNGTGGISGKMEIFVHLKKDGREYVVMSPRGVRRNKSDFYFYYPDTDAFKITVVRYDTANAVVRRDTIPLTPHPLLNGAYYFSGFNPSFGSTLSVPEISKDVRVRYPSKIYTSVANNPFLFRPAMMNSVGNGDITALCSATKAISEGQFGQFPMHAFTSEGIWALEVNETGGYSSRQPVTRDILCGKKVLQLDQALAYPTEKGIMMLQGGVSQCISSVLDGTFNPGSIIRYMQIAGELGFEDHNSNYNFKEFIKGSVLAYDYVNSRIYISNNHYGYSYIYSTIPGKWSIITDSFAGTVNSYPDSVITMRPLKHGTVEVREDVCNLTGKEYYNTGMIITRPLKLGEPVLLKTVSAVISRGMFSTRNGIMKTVLLGSADGINYIPAASSLSGHIRNIRGSGYKFFRLMHELRLKPEECFSGVEIEFEPRRTNRLR